METEESRDTEQPQKPQESNAETSGASRFEYQSPPDEAEGISLPLLTKMSSERTLAVQAALMQQQKKAIALLTWQLCRSVFSGGYYTRSRPFRISLTESHSTLTGNAPSGEDGAAFLTLTDERKRLEALLPHEWAKDFTTFFSLNDETLMALMTFCVACSVAGNFEVGCRGDECAIAIVPLWTDAVAIARYAVSHNGGYGSVIVRSTDKSITHADFKTWFLDCTGNRRS